ncbi:helix-turn-helix domain-containing protein [Roseibium sp. Sym1]|uniref:helix-turn-helix domain-containing protein n=1 Tax=Roseibium sp. Sym1 TaxID=3016006 RepID=UPI0022B3E1E3|nr:S24 family peptidase [Roseibium sp. Sym1]
MHVSERFRKLRERAGLSRDTLAKELGYTVGSSIQRYETPELFKAQAFKPELVRKLRKVLVGRGDPEITDSEVIALGQIPGEELPTIPPPPNALPPQTVDASGWQRIPIFGQAVGGADGRFELNGNFIDSIFAPPSLSSVKNAYAVMIVGESMEPRYIAGETVYVHPHVPVRAGDYVVLQIKDNKTDDLHGYVKRFKSLTKDKLTVTQLNPQKSLTFPRDSVESIHRIVFSGSTMTAI